MAAPPEQIGAALQRAGQYAGDSTVWTKENAPDVGLDPERGYVAKGTPIYAPPPPAPAQVKPTPANIPQAKAPAKDAEPAYPGAIPVVNPEQEQMQKQAAAFKEQQRLGQPAGSQPGVNQPKQLGEPEKGYEGAIAVDQPKPEAKKDDPNAYPGAIPADEQPKQPQAAQPPQGPQAQQPPQQRPQAQQQPPPGTYPTITSDQGGPGTPAQPPGIQPPAIQPPSAEQAQQPPQTVTPSVPPSVPPSASQRVKVEGITPLTDDEAKEPKIDIQSNGYTKGRGNQSLRHVILHSTDGKSEQGDINQLTQSGKVGVQYYVTKDGRIMHFVNDGDSAWQAGKDRSGGNANPYTIGIEQQHVDGKDAWPDLQVRSTAKVVASILKRNPNLTIDDVMGHSDIAGERKQDPVGYPWEHFRNYVRAYLNITSDQISASGKPAGHLAAGPGDQAKQADVLKTLNQAGLNATHFGYKNDPYLDPESGAGHGKYVEHMVKGYDVALNAAAAAKVGNPKPGEEFTFAGQKWRYGDAVPERYSDARFDIFDPDNQFSGGGLFAGAGGGKKGTSAPATAGAPAGPLAGQPMFSIPSAPRRPEGVAESSQPPSGGGGGGGGVSYGGQQEVSQRAGDINLGSFPDAAAIAMMMRRGGGQQPQRTGAAAAPPAEEEQPSALVAALVKRGFTQQQAEAYALGKQTTVPYTARLQPPAAPGVQGPAPLALGPPAAPGGIAGSQADALKTLQALGIKKGQAQAMLQGAKGKTVQELVRSALQAQQQAKGGAVPKTRPVQAQVVTQPPTPQAAVAGRPPTPQERRAQIAAHTEQAIAEKRPMHISYISAPKEAARHPTRESRTIQYEEHSPEARLMGTTTGQLVGHSLIPVESKVTKEGEPYVLGLSTNVMANNHRHVNEKLAAMGRKSPYPGLDHNFFNGVEGYLANLNAGHTGTGQGYQVGTEEHPIDPNLSHVPHKLTHQQADFINLVINNTKAFAKANQPLRELARANGTLITEAGETNRMRHDIEQHEPGWRQRVLEPSVRSFKSGLIHEVHPTEESLPETIRPGPEYQHLTKTLHRAIQRGRPDIPISVSLHHNFEHNKLINRIERDFSDGKLNEPDARAKLESMGEDPDQYRFIAGSGGLITPYEESPEAITPEEHSQLKDNLRKQWIGGKMPVEDYRRKVAEVPLPEIASRKTTTTSEGTEALAPAPKPPKLVKPPPAEPQEEGPTEEPAPEPPQKKPISVPKPPPAPEPLPKAVPAKPQAPVESPPAPGEVPAPTKAKALTKPAPSAAPEKPDWETADEPTRQKYLKKRVKQILANQSTDESAIPLKALKNDDGSYRYDPQGNPTFDKPGYNIVNSPFLKKKGLDQLDEPDKHEDTIDPDQHGHLNFTERRRLSALRHASAVETMGNKILESYNSIKDIPEIAAGKGWYSRMRDKLAKALGPDNEIFAQLLGATSAKTPVRSNFIQALDAYEKWKRGDFDRHAQKYLEAHHKMEEGDGALTQHMRNLGILGENDPDHKTDAHAMAHWIEHHDILPKQQTGAKYNANSNAVLKVLAGTWLKEADAPKTPNFAGNLTGRTKEATIDVWAARHIKRLGHEGLTGGKPWRDQAKGESGVSGLDFAYSQDAMRHAADKIGINPDDLQAILWYAEKHHYEKQGWTRGEGAKKASFDDVFDKVFHKSGEPMNSTELRSHYAEEAKTARQLAGKVKTARGYHEAGSPKLAPYMEKHGLTQEHLAAPEEEEEAA